MTTMTSTCVDDDFGAGILDPIECHFCRATATDVLAAIEADWIPSFFDGDDPGEEVCDPVCPDCQEEFLRLASDGEMELKPRATATEGFSL